jgi:superfamily I DNA/RNA helicase
LVSSFTRTAARELIQRDLPINDDQIGTLHALCYRSLDRPKLVSKEHLKDWNREHPQMAMGGAPVNPDDPYADFDGSLDAQGDRLLQDYNRLKGLQLPEDSWPLSVQSFAEAWRDFKDHTMTIDFTDLIEQCLVERVSIPHGARVFFLDEVQDFSPLELSLARHWGDGCELFYLAGDDDQCLYAFKGATPDAFLFPELPTDQVRVLAQSYRVPRAVHAAATDWVEGMSVRMPKVYRPRDFDGSVETLPITYKYLDPILGQIEEWLNAGKTIAFLASCSYMLDPLKHQLRAWGLPFHNPYRKARGDWNPLTARAGTVSASARLLAYRKVADWHQWWTNEEVWHWAASLEADGVFSRGSKSAIRRLAEDATTKTLPAKPEDLEAWFSDPLAGDAATTGQIDWLQGHLLSAYEKPMRYACSVLEARGHAALIKPPSIMIGTIHSFKGAEADVVVLFPDLSQSGFSEWTTPGESQDSVRRMFYVGMTRAKESLYWANPFGMSIGGYL